MIPPDIEEFMKTRHGAIRSDTDEVRAALKQIGVSEATQFGQFFSRFNVYQLPPAMSGDELLDLVTPSQQIVTATNYAHDAYQIPARYVALTSGEGEGFLLYDRESEAVYDVGIADVPSLLDGSLKPQWSSFFSFIRWYISNPFRSKR